MTNHQPTLADIQRARTGLTGVANVTPVLTSRSLDAMTQAARIYFKAESVQRGGSFKIRGAYTKLASLDPKLRARGVVAFSSGNHGQGVALAARAFGVPALICMPNDAARTKIAAVLEYGGEIVSYDRFTQDREALAQEIATSRGLALVRPYDDPQVIAGQGTAMLEVFDQIPEQPDLVIVPVGGGGLISGIAIAAKGIAQAIRVVGVEADDADDTRLSLAAGHRVSIPPPRTIADGMRGQTPGELTFPIVQRLVDAIETVSDDEIRRAVRFAAFRMKNIFEPTGAVGLALLLSGKLDVTDKVVVVLVSGGNIDPQTLAGILADPAVP